MLMQLRNGHSSYKSINVVLSDLSLVKGKNDRIFAKWGQNVAPKSHIWGPHNFHVTMITMITMVLLAIEYSRGLQTNLKLEG